MEDPESLPDVRLDRLRAALAEDPVSGPDPEGRAQAAVSLVLRTGDELDVLLIRRARLAGDPWAGHMALPGGRREVGDASLAHTAVRETREETGLHLGEMGSPLGRLEPVLPVSRSLPSISITPFVFGVPPEAEAGVASPEVDAVLWVPLSLFQRPEALEDHFMEVPGGGREFPGFRVEEGVVWGLTYRIITDFLEACPWTRTPTASGRD